MRIKRVVLKNFGPHVDFDVDLKCGLIGIVGRNGSGKSTFVDGIYAALTNDFSRFDGVKAERINDNAPASAPSYVAITAEHDSVEFTITRSLRPNKSSLQLPDELITNSNTIEERLRKDLGVDMKLISTYVFVRQWCMFQFLDQTPAERAQAFKHLCRTGQASVIYDALAKVISSHQINENEVIDNSDELASSVAELSHTILQLRKEQEGLVSEKLLNEQSLQSATKIIAQCARLEELRVDVVLLSNRVSRLLAKRDSLTTYIVKLRKRLKRLKSTFETNASEAVKAQAALDSYAVFVKRKKRTDLLKADLAEAENILTTTRLPIKPASYANFAADETALAVASKQLVEANDYVRANKNEATGKCPTCGQAVDTKLYDKFYAVTQVLPATVKALQESVAACKAYDASVRKYDSVISSATIQRDTATADLATYDDLVKPDVSKESLTTIVTEHGVLFTAIADGDKLLATRQERLAKLEGKCEQVAKQAASIATKIESYSKSEPKLAKASLRKAEHDIASTRVAVIDSLLSEKLKQALTFETQIKVLKAAKLRRRKITEACKVAGQVRELFHWSGLPNQVAQANLAGMEDDINHTLSWFGNPFWVEADKGLGFQVHMPGKLPKRAESLSGGQKAVLAVAFRVAVNTLFAADIGMMWLDEPTVGLDEQNVEYFHDSLVKLASEVRNKRQIAVITHAGDLKTAFDQVIEF